MENLNKQTKYVVQSGLIGALYAALTYLASVFNLSYGPIQFRFSEALTILPVFTPAAIPGLTIGCFLGNINSPYGAIDIVCGTLATFLAAICSRAVRKIRIKGLPILSPLMPVIFNAIIIGAEIAFTSFQKGNRWIGFVISGLQVGIGELVMCYVLGLVLYKVIDSTRLKKMF